MALVAAAAERFSGRVSKARYDAAMPAVFREIHIIGRDSPERIVDAVCPAMRTYGIHLAGLTDAGKGYAMQRPASRFGHLLVCHGGRGRVWVDGSYVACGPGQAYLSPAGVPMGFEPARGRRWSFAWVYYDDGRPGHPSVITGDRCVLMEADAWPMTQTILGLYRESIGWAQPTMMDRWVELLQAEVVRIVEPTRGEPALGAVWEQVDRRLSYPWSLEALAGLAGLSRESLRIACQRRLGRSPMAQVTFLRMQRAAALLSTTPQTVEAIGRHVGYPRVSAFCTAFRRVMGTPPNAYRTAKGRAGRGDASR